jgi:hypothetical protein
MAEVLGVEAIASQSTLSLFFAGFTQLNRSGLEPAWWEVGSPPIQAKPGRCQLNTLRWRLVGRAAVWSRARGKPILKLAVHEAARACWLHILEKLTSPPNCHAVESLQA